MADLDGKSELAHRIMLTNVLRLVGKIQNCKQQRRILGKVCVVVVPLKRSIFNIHIRGNATKVENDISNHNVLTAMESVELSRTHPK